MKRIYLEGYFSTHSLYRELIDYPPEGYEFVCMDSGQDRLFQAVGKIDITHEVQKASAKIIPENLIKSAVQKFKKTPTSIDLTYATHHVVLRKEPWIMDLEFVHSPLSSWPWNFNRYKWILENCFSSKYCRKIIPWSNAGLQTITDNLNCSGFYDKLAVIPYAVRVKYFNKIYNTNHLRLLFIGSSNIKGEFEIKGGKEVLEAFNNLRENRHDIELVVRSDVPLEIKKKYENMPGLKIIDTIISSDALEKEYLSADIFIFPSHNSPAMAILEAMSYELPVITTDVFANPELIKDGKNGLLIKKTKKAHYFLNNLPNWGTPKFMSEISIPDPIVVNELTNKINLLLNNEDLRKNLGKAGRQEIETGKFSIKHRNNLMKNLFDEITQNY